ncbi:hypothetical protein GCM10009077_43830 [Roseibium denhamense]
MVAGFNGHFVFPVLAWGMGTLPAHIALPVVPENLRTGSASMGRRGHCNAFIDMQTDRNSVKTF